uniref:Uncharacterized protein n=1 Tax=Craspedostauros australis TaxID=1486917 RepID=A0A7R9WQ99_9STRA|mmetsp:Transcript_12545/g.34567  ORF Transcript_12545/g.34567 Transcript_12545/m.34567 type:complete len:177 (+) Transcript_12545:358-888(+)
MGKKVVFDEDRNQCLEIESTKDLPELHKARLWYTKAELAESQHNDQRAMKDAMRGIEGEEFDPRGLEARSPEQDFLRKNTTIEVIQAVIDEQQRQKTEGVFDDEIISAISQELTYNSRKKARKLGKEDGMCIPEVAVKMKAERDAKRARKASLEPPPEVRKRGFRRMFDRNRRRSM